MSSLLKQAIIDANLLKESAERQAEKAILEKYSSEIKDVYESMLEVAPDPLADMAGEKSAQRDLDLDFENDLDFEGDSMDAQIPYSFADGEAMMGAPDQEEEIEIDFDKLAAMLGDVEPDNKMDSEPLDMGLAGDEDAEDFELPTELGGGDELPMKETDKFKLRSKAMGNAPEDTMKNISPNVKDKDVKTAPKSRIIEPEKQKTIDIEENKNTVCEMCGKNHMGEGCNGKIKESEEKLSALRAYREYSKAANAGDKLPGRVSQSTTQYFKNKAEKARQEYIRLSGGQDPDLDSSSSDQPDDVLPDDVLNGIDEKIVMDDTGNKSGWTSRPTDILSHELDKKVAHDKFDKTDGEEFKDGDYKDLEEKDTEYDSLKEEYNNLKKNFKEIFKENSNLKELNNNYEVRIDNLSEKNKQFLSLLEKAQYELQDNQIKMMKLFYENKVFRDASLNERQKNNIVEVISEINTVEQIKPVYEALLKTKGTISHKGESLNSSLQEAIKNRPRIARMAASTNGSGESKEQQVANDPLTERMQKLAGIKK